MKKTFWFTVGIVFMLFLISCNKQATCECSGEYWRSFKSQSPPPYYGYGYSTYFVGQIEDTTFLVKREKECFNFDLTQSKDSSGVIVEDIRKYSCQIK